MRIIIPKLARNMD